MENLQHEEITPNCEIMEKISSDSIFETENESNVNEREYPDEDLNHGKNEIEHIKGDAKNGRTFCIKSQNHNLCSKVIQIIYLYFLIGLILEERKVAIFLGDRKKGEFE